MGRFTQIPQNAFDALQLDAGVLLKHFDIEAAAAGELGFDNSDIICATTGGITASCVPEYSDFAEDVDNAPNNLMEFKHNDGWTCTVSTTSLGTSAELIKLTLGCADIDGETKIVPRRDLEQTDFSSIWWVGDKANGGFLAIQILNALSTGGFSLQTSKNAKGNVTLEITGHVSLSAQDVVPMQFYSIDVASLGDITIEPESGSTEMFGTLVSDMQSGVYVASGEVHGTLKYLDTGALVDQWGAGNFLALKFSDIGSDIISVKVGLEPSMGSGLVEIIDDPDKNGAFKITDKNAQKFKIISTDGKDEHVQTYNLSTLTLETA